MIDNPKSGQTVHYCRHAFVQTVEVLSLVPDFHFSVRCSSKEGEILAKPEELFEDQLDAWREAHAQGLDAIRRAHNMVVAIMLERSRANAGGAS